MMKSQKSFPLLKWSIVIALFMFLFVEISPILAQNPVDLNKVTQGVKSETSKVKNLIGAVAAILFLVGAVMVTYAFLSKSQELKGWIMGFFGGAIFFGIIWAIL